MGRKGDETPERSQEEEDSCSEILWARGPGESSCEHPAYLPKKDPQGQSVVMSSGANGPRGKPFQKGIKKSQGLRGNSGNTKQVLSAGGSWVGEVRGLNHLKEKGGTPSGGTEGGNFIRENVSKNNSEIAGQGRTSLTDLGFIIFHHRQGDGGSLSSKVFN